MSSSKIVDAESGIEVIPDVPTRAEISRLETHMLSMPQLEIQATHHFAKGLYAREIFIPAGTLLTGKVHKCEHLNIVSKGRIQVWTEDGMKEVCAPFTLVSRPGTKRVGLAIEDTVWTTIHATGLGFSEVTPAALADLENELIDPATGISNEVQICLG
jgi:hypothetical protein